MFAIWGEFGTISILLRNDTSSIKLWLIGLNLWYSGNCYKKFLSKGVTVWMPSYNNKTVVIRSDIPKYYNITLATPNVASKNIIKMENILFDCASYYITKNNEAITKMMKWLKMSKEVCMA